jgi:hypothetical protein
MVLTDDELSKYTKAIRWAQIPTNRKSLDPEFEALLQFIELKLDTLKPKQRTQQMTVTFGANILKLDFQVPNLPNKEFLTIAKANV